MDSYHKISTKFGNVYLKPTSDSHIYVDANHNCGSSHIEEGIDRHGPLTVNNVEMGVTAHFYKWSDGKWRIGKERADWSSTCHALHASKLIYKNYNSMDASESARKKLTDELTTVVGNWVAQNPQALHAASVEYLEAKLKKAEDTFKEKRLAAYEAEQEMNSARDALKVARTYNKEEGKA
jgi:hypothetical protein